jgi:pimeloyl-ACP methyl ester carboxylesterase
MLCYTKTMETWKKIAYSIAGLSFFQLIALAKPRKFYSNALPADHDIDFEPISFETQDGVKIAGWWLPGKGKRKDKATIIVGHGYPFDKGNIFQATRWLWPDFNLLYYDHRSFGESEGSITTGGNKERLDVEAAIIAARSRSKGTIGLYGFSLSAAAMLMADHTDVTAIVADSTYTSTEDLIKDLYGGLGPFGWPFSFSTNLMSRLLLPTLRTSYKSPIQSIAQTKIPILLLHSKGDTQIPFKHVMGLYRASNKETTELVIVDDGEHGQTLIKPKIRKKIKDFFKQQLR